VRRLTFRERVLISMWFVPALFAVGALALSLITLRIDSRAEIGADWLPASTPGAAEALSTTVAAGMLTFTGVVFSTTLVAIQLAGGQYSPRVVRLFVRSTLTHVTLGVFLATFIVALNALVETRDGEVVSVPTLTLLLLYGLVGATVVMFIAFCHGIVQLIRVQYLMSSITRQGREAIARYVPAESEYLTAPAPVPDPQPQLVPSGVRPGVIQAIDLARVAALAEETGTWIELLLQPGEYVSAESPVANVHSGTLDDASQARLMRCMMLGGERTMIQDPGFALRQLVDVAGRALSPAVNDPTTAVQAIDRITELLAALARRPDPAGDYVGSDGRVRVRVPEPDFARLATLAYSEIGLFGAASPQVVRRLLSAYANLEALTDGARRDTIRALRARTEAEARAAMPASILDAALTPDRLGFG
jgi:uncharacterized membrane protein